MKQKKKRPQLPFRLNILFFVVFLLFSILIIQLGIVQILNGEAAQEEIDRTIQETTKIPVPRGKILDRNHQVIVDNKAHYSITYTPPKGVQAKDNLKLAKKLAKYISMDTKEDIDGVTLRNKKEYWYLENTKKAQALLTDEEMEELDDIEQYDLILDRIKEEDVSEFTNDELEVIAIKKELDKAYALTPQTVKNKNITPEEYAKVAEHLDELPGINATTDWERKYEYKDTFKSFIGSITSEDQGIPAEDEQYYLTRGYNRNDRVGKSGLEEQYEELLRGRKEQVEHTTTKTGKVIDSKVVVPGQRGKDLVLTIDMELQKKVDDIVRKELKAAIGTHPYQNRYLEDAMVVAMHPKTGEILAISGQHYNKEKNKFEDAGYKAVYDAHRPGSAIKGATVLAGLEEGVISPNQTFYDRPIKIAGSSTMGSIGHRSLGPVNDITALQKSSNVYMFYIALRMGGEYRYPFPDNASIKYNLEGLQKLRNYFNQFGLGVKTGVDYPYESTGYVGPKPEAYHPLHFSIGQFDTYTTLQLAQYVSTIANDGYRVKPHFLKAAYDPSPNKDELGPLYRSTNPEVLNRVDMSEEHIERVQEGFRRVFREPGGTGAGYWSNKKYNAVGKTGTAQNEIYKDGVKLADTNNLALVGYAPYDDPEIAFAVIAPNLGVVSGQYPISHKIGTGVLDTYFDLKEKRESGKKENDSGEE